MERLITVLMIVGALTIGIGAWAAELGDETFDPNIFWQWNAIQVDNLEGPSFLNVVVQNPENSNQLVALTVEVFDCIAAIRSYAYMEKDVFKYFVHEEGRYVGDDVVTENKAYQRGLLVRLKDSLGGAHLAFEPKTLEKAMERRIKCP